ncbi:MAG: PIN domain-containing protein [bacterium]|nr:PIN domain-containing protein [bacterium]
MHKPRVFLDSSVIIAALLSPRGGSYYLLTQLSDALALEINEYVFEEVRRTLTIKFSDQPALISNLFATIGLADVATISNPSKREVTAAEKLISKKDAPILASAIAESDFLVTLDNEFFKAAIVEVAKQRNLKILKPGDLVKLFER